MHIYKYIGIIITYACATISVPQCVYRSVCYIVCFTMCV